MWTCKQGCKLKSVVWTIRRASSADYRLPADVKEWHTVKLGRAIRGSTLSDSDTEQEGPVCEVCMKKWDAHFEKHNEYMGQRFPEWTYWLEWIE